MVMRCLLSPRNPDPGVSGQLVFPGSRPNDRAGCAITARYLSGERTSWPCQASTTRTMTAYRTGTSSAASTTSSSWTRQLAPGRCATLVQPTTGTDQSVLRQVASRIRATTIIAIRLFFFPTGLWFRASSPSSSPHDPSDLSLYTRWVRGASEPG